MTPTITSTTITSKENQPLNNKVRKPMVEKRRDRINSSIAELKSLLTPEFLNQQSDSKLEKADILEMTLHDDSPDVLMRSYTSCLTSTICSYLQTRTGEKVLDLS